MHPVEGSGEIKWRIVRYTHIWNHPGPCPLHSSDFVEAIHALICCCQLSVTGYLYETQSYAAVVFIDLPA